MEVVDKNPRINILINLSSRLICEALQEYLKGVANFWPEIYNAEANNEFEPHNILVDATTLKNSCTAQYCEAKVILIDTGLAEDEIIRLIMTHKLHGVISTGTGAELFCKALETIRAGQVWIDNSKIMMLLHNPPGGGKRASHESFSKRERQIVLLVAGGRTNREIAEHLKISEQTIKTHLSRIFSKADVTNRTQLAPLALKFKLESASSA